MRQRRPGLLFSCRPTSRSYPKVDVPGGHVGLSGRLLDALLERKHFTPAARDADAGAASPSMATATARPRSTAGFTFSNVVAILFRWPMAGLRKTVAVALANRKFPKKCADGSGNNQRLIKSLINGRQSH